MTTEVVDQEKISTDQAAETAAFEASFDGESEVVQPAEPSKPEAVETKPEQAQAAKPEEPQQTKPTEAAPKAPIPKDDDAELKGKLRRLEGRFGALNDQLHTLMKAKETEGKPAVLSTVQLTRMKNEYPEMAEMLEVDIAEVMKGLSGKADPKEIEDLVTKRVAAEVFNLRVEAITDRHEKWETDCWADTPGGTRTPAYQAWINTMTKEEASAFEQSQNPSFVNRKLDQFYDWKNKATQAAATEAKAETEKQNRLKAAITPQGTARAGPQTISDDEALQKGFSEGFNS